SADFDQDGIPDLVVACFYSGAKVINYFKGAGDATFQLLNTVDFGPGAPGGMVVADINSDGIPDLFLSLVDDSYVIPTFPDPQGLFSAGLTVGEGLVVPGPAVTGDFNGDGKTDFAVLGAAGSALTTMLGDGSGNFQIVNNSLSWAGQVPLAADFN